MSEQEAPPEETSTEALPAEVGFANPFFAKLDGLYFRKSEQTGEPVAVVRLGDAEVSLPFAGIKRELKLEEDDPDAKMLDLIGQGLDYVRFIRPGGPLPRELTTREASWEPSDRHRRIAHQRLTLQLVSWLAGDEHVITNPEELQQVADDPATRKKVQAAFAEAAERLGLGRDRRDEVVNYIEHLSKELSYIEAMRDVFGKIQVIEKKVQALRKLYGHERSMMEVVDPVARLMARAVKELGEFFMQVDAQTCEILGLLRNIEGHTEYIRMIRDELHKRLMAWDEILARWQGVKPEASPEKGDLLRETYHFLAPRYMHVQEWVLMTKLQEHHAEVKAVSLMGPAQNKIKFRKGVMEW